MQWSEFQPYVLPYVIGCPDPVLEHHARLASIEFCRRTGCLTRMLGPIATDGVSHAITLSPGAGLQAIKLKSVTVDAQPWTLATTEHGHELADAQRLDDFAFVSGNAEIQVHPLQAAGLDVLARAVLAPTMTASTCPDDLLPYLQDIAHGAAASLMLIPAQAFTNPAHAQQEQAAFNARIATVAAKISRGNSSAKMRSRPTFL